MTGQDRRRRGLSDAGRDEVGSLVLGAWDALLDQVDDVDLTRPSRLPGWRAQEICVHLGSWPDHRPVEGLLASARTGATGTPPDPGRVNARVLAAHRDAPRDDVLAALRRHREDTARFLTDGPRELDTAPALTAVGPVPLLGAVLGQAYELAVHGLDLASCGAAAPSARALDAGLAALVDVTGALAAACGINGGVTLLADEGGWAFAADTDGWTVRRVPAGASTGPTVAGRAALLLDAAAGRVNPVPAAVRRELRVHDPVGLLALTPIVSRVPGVPGGQILQLAARTMRGPGGLLGRLLR